MNEPLNLPEDPANTGAEASNDLDPQVHGTLTTPSQHNVGTVHSTSSMIRPSFAAIANAGITSAQNTPGRTSHSPHPTTPTSSPGSSPSPARNAARNAARAAQQQTAQTQKPASTTKPVKLPPHASANNGTPSASGAQFTTNTSVTNTSGNSTGGVAAGGNVAGGHYANHTNVPNVATGATSQGLPPLNIPGISGDNVKDWHQILITVGKTHGEAVVKLANFVIARKYVENPLRATGLAADMLENATDEFCENLITLIADGWDQSLGALFTCARTL